MCNILRLTRYTFRFHFGRSYFHIHYRSSFDPWLGEVQGNTARRRHGDGIVDLSLFILQIHLIAVAGAAWGLSRSTRGPRGPG